MNSLFDLPPICRFLLRPETSCAVGCFILILIFAMAVQIRRQPNSKRSKSNPKQRKGLKGGARERPAAVASEARCRVRLAAEMARVQVIRGSARRGGAVPGTAVPR